MGESGSWNGPLGIQLEILPILRWSGVISLSSGVSEIVLAIVTPNGVEFMSDSMSF